MINGTAALLKRAQDAEEEVRKLAEEKKALEKRLSKYEPVNRVWVYRRTLVEDRHIEAGTREEARKIAGAQLASNATPAYPTSTIVSSSTCFPLGSHAACVDCGTNTEEVDYAPCLYMSDVHNDDTPVWLCAACRNDRASNL